MNEYSSTDILKAEVLQPRDGIPTRKAADTFVCSCGQTISHGIDNAWWLDHTRHYHGACGQCKIDPCACPTIFEAQKTIPFYPVIDEWGGGDEDEGEQQELTYEDGTPVPENHRSRFSHREASRGDRPRMSR